MIVNLRGTHGSGKSTTARLILKMFPPNQELLDDEARHVGHTVQLPRSILYVIGPYRASPCGGCDAIQPYARVLPLVQRWARDGHVLFEGALISTTFGQIGEAARVYGPDFCYGFLNTPLELCVQRVQSRRAARGAAPLTNLHSIESKWRTVDRLRRRLVSEIEAGELTNLVRTIDFARPVTETLRLFDVTIPKEPIE